MNWQLAIQSNPDVMMGKPCFKGTRIPVELILEKMGKGESFSSLLEAYPALTEELIRAALLFAAESVKHHLIFSNASWSAYSLGR